jgi:uncharacterized protein (DUF58 family)
MRWIGWLFQNRTRRLEVSVGGRWFLGFTIVLGVVAINSGNNVIYLLESLLLSSLLFSGILSELTLTRIEFTRVPRAAVAGEPTGDLLLVQNTGWLPLFCVELGEWREGKFHSAHFLLSIPGRGTRRLFSPQVIEERGRHRWDSLALATSFPFGFARKIRLLGKAGDRLVWPRRALGSAGREQSSVGEWEPAEGEIEEVDPWEDTSRVHWPTSARTGQLMARPQRRVNEAEVVYLPAAETAEAREELISRASDRLQRNARALVIEEPAGPRRIDGAWRALDALALLPKECA